MKWSKEEDEILVKNFETVEKEQLLQLLPNRSWDSITLRGNRIFKLSRNLFNRRFEKGNTYSKGNIPWNKGKEHLRGEKHPGYKGDEYTYVSNRGYRIVRIREDTAKWKGYRPEHLVVVEKNIGRSLERSKDGHGEGVHHIDGDKLNNDLSNLFLYADESEHRTLHSTLEKVAFELVQKEIIVFDIESRRYKINDSRIA